MSIPIIGARALLGAGLTLLMTVVVADSPTATTEPAAAMNETITFFYYDDIETQVPFYEGLLKLTPTMETDWVRIYRITPTSSVGLVLNGRGFHPVSDDKPAMLSLVTDEVDAWYARLRAAGVTVRSELPPPDAEKEEGRAPVRGFIVEDPGGYTIEIFSWQK